MEARTRADRGSSGVRRRRAAARARAVRRRRIALGLLAVVAMTAGASVGSGAGDGEPAEPPTLDELLGAKLVVRMEAEATGELRRRARAGQIGGVILFPPPGTDPAILATEIERLQAAASRGGRPPLLVTIDQEGGSVKRLPDGPPQLSPAEIGARADPERASREGRETGRFLAEAGVNVDLAPVLDVPASNDSFLGRRAFGEDPDAVARIGAPFAQGLAVGGLAATAKHFPGLGLAEANTDVSPVRVTASEKRLRVDLLPFRAAIESGIAMVMMSSATYPALDPGAPAVFSPQIVGTELREELGFSGLVITDDLYAEAIAAERPPSEAAVAAAAAGVDLLLFAREDAPAGTLRAMRRAARSGELDRAALEESAARIERLRIGSPPGS